MKRETEIGVGGEVGDFEGGGGLHGEKELSLERTQSVDIEAFIARDLAHLHVADRELFRHVKIETR